MAQTPVDWLRAFAFSQFPVRGALVSLPASWQQLTARRQYVQPLDRWLADMLSAITLVRSGIKADGRLSLQIRSQGNPHLLSVECNECWRIRGTVRFSDDQSIAADLDAIQSGVLAMQLEPPQQQVSYQGVVPLQGKTIGLAMQHYFTNSEQLPTQFVLGLHESKHPWGLMLQRMPGEMDEDDWRRLCILADTLQGDELTMLDAKALLKRLYPEDQLELFATQQPTFHCACSRVRVSRMLLQLGQEEANSIINQEGEVSVACEHCGEQYQFDAIDIRHLFTSNDVTAPISDQLQ